MLRVLFLRANAKREKAAPAGLKYNRAELDQLDLSDWKNPAFRYVA